VLEIRDARLDDADAMCDAHVEAWRVGYRGIVPDDILDAEAFEQVRRTGWRSERWRNFERSELLAAVVDECVVGFAHIGPERSKDSIGERGEVYGFYLHPDAWGSGTASALMQESEARLRHSGFGEAVLWCLRDNGRGRGFYEKAGWAWSGEESTFELARDRDTRPVVSLPEVQYRRDL